MAKIDVRHPSGLPFVSKTHKTADGGDITFHTNGAPWVTLRASLDITVRAAVGDIFLVGLNALWTGAGDGGFLEVCTLDNGGNPVTRYAGDDWGIPSWIGSGGLLSPVGGPIVFPALVSGDIVNGNVKFRLRGITSTATDKVLQASDARPLQFWALNLKQLGS
jgi:hypothetical protein